MSNHRAVRFPAPAIAPARRRLAIVASVALACLVVAGSVHAAAEAKPPSQAPKREQAIETLKGESKATR